MGLLSSSVSIARYKVSGTLENPVLQKVAKGLKEYAISEIDENVSEKTIGWTSFEDPFHPNFEGSSFAIGSQMVFSLRIDKKSIPAKVIKKYYAIEMAKKLTESGREYLTRNEKQALKENVVAMLSMRIPATPNVYDLIWNHEESLVWFFSTQKAANEELETLFYKSFDLPIVRLFPYTIADLESDLSDTQKDVLNKLSQTKFTE